MAEAMISGVIGAKLSTPSDISAGEPMETRRKHLTEKYGVIVTPNNTEALDSSDLVVLAVKPQQLPKVMLTTRSTLTEDQVVLSIVAGATIKTLTTGLNHSSIIRVMPNTPAQIGAGMTVWTASGNVPQEKISVSKKILRTLGDELYVDNESFVDMATALSASGPAYVFLFMEALIDAGVHMGMSREMAERLVTMHGDSSSSWVNAGWQMALGRPPSEDERHEALALLEGLASEEALQDDRENTPSGLAGIGPARLSALTELCLTLFNLNEFVYID